LLDIIKDGRSEFLQLSLEEFTKLLSSGIHCLTVCHWFTVHHNMLTVWSLVYCSSYYVNCLVIGLLFIILC